MEEIKCISIVSDLVTIENPFNQSYKLGNLFTKRGQYVITRLSMFKSATCCCTAIKRCCVLIMPQGWTRNMNYTQFIKWQGSPQVNPCILVGLTWSEFCHADRFQRNIHSHVLQFTKVANSEQTSLVQVSYNKLLSNLACLSHTGEYWPLVIFVQTILSLVQTAMTSHQYSPVHPLYLVKKKLLFHQVHHLTDKKLLFIQ